MKERYRVVIPVDVWIEPSEDLELDQEKVFDLLQDGLNKIPDVHDLLQLQDIQLYKELE
jgi:hypothetical protein